MKIVVLSDTHISKPEFHIPSRLIEELKTAEKIIHAGDWQTIEVHEKLSTYAPVEGVYGNVDGEGIKKCMPEKKSIQVNGFSIGIVHGHGEKKTTIHRAIEAFSKEDVDCIIFGHSHIPHLQYYKKTLLFNPGSATQKRKLPYFSFGVLTITEEIKAEHIFYSTKE
ncbi:metallophosphoesterase family protein [Evansella sp. AB-rgal1]|uniref:metallophosphoesterase family protein n=1 Tax=Evansella sp. AB-rgal1 TaxID=3242696 RepID=UPI00359E72BA